MNKDTHRGQAVYSKQFLSIYDYFVLGFSSTYIWDCHRNNIVDLFRSEITDDHLDVGVGTGFFLSESGIANFKRIGLMDLNENSLKEAEANISGTLINKYCLDILSDLEIKEEKKYSSISINYLLHCLPGDVKTKAKVFDNLVPLLENDGVLFGGTIVGQGIKHPVKAKMLMWLYNKFGVFTNSGDSLQGLQEVLSSRFSSVDIKVIGSVAMFCAKNKIN